jgi:hypothetical protein
MDLWSQDFNMTRNILPRSDTGWISIEPVSAGLGNIRQSRIMRPYGQRAIAAAMFGTILAAATCPAALAFPFDHAMRQGIAETGAARLQRTGGEDFKVDDIAGTGSTPQPLKIQLPENPTVTYSFLMFRNMPPKFTLSAGFGAKDYWAVSLHDIDGLQMIAPDGYEGAFTMEVLLVKGVGADPERRLAKVDLKEKPSSPAVASRDDTKVLTSTRPDEATASIPPLNPSRQNSAQSGELTGIDQSMMERGDTYLKQGDVAAARLLYRQLAKKGIASGALAMGNTYDPEFLSSLAVRGLQPDIGQAKNWYRMAEELGSAQAARRLSKLNSQGN